MIQQQTRPKSHGMTPNHNKSGIYKLKCKTCNKVYIGQTSHNLSLRYREHIRCIKNNDHQSAYAQHILQNIHEYGTLADSMTLLKPLHDTAKLNPYEQLFFQAFHHNGDLIDEQSNTDHNPLFQLAKGTNSTPHTAQQPINT